MGEDEKQVKCECPEPSEKDQKRWLEMQTQQAREIAAAIDRAADKIADAVLAAAALQTLGDSTATQFSQMLPLHLSAIKKMLNKPCDPDDE